MLNKLAPLAITGAQDIVGSLSKTAEDNDGNIGKRIRLLN